MQNILFTGVVFGLLLTVFLYNKRVNVIANRMLALTLAAYSLDIFYAYFTVTELYLEYPFLIGLSAILPFIYSPSLFLYTRIVSSNRKDLELKYLFNFAPALIMLLASLIGFFIYSDEAKISLMNPEISKTLFITIMRTIIPFYGITYIILSLRYIHTYHHRLKENFSDIEKLKLHWLIYLIVGFLFVWILEFIQIILIDIAGKPETIAYKYIYVTVSVLMIVVTYKSLKQPEIFSEVELKEQEVETNISKDNQTTSSYLKSGLTEKRISEIVTRLTEIVERDKSYLNSNLSLSDLAEQIGISTHNLSEVINTKLNKSFYDFINYYRVQEVKKMLNDEKYKSQSILSVAFEAGFNSKTSFNTIFKKIAGVTPTEFRRRSKN